MSLGDTLRRKLALPGVRQGTVEVEGEGGRVEVELEDADRLGARIRRLRVSVSGASDLPGQAERLCERVRGLGERLVPVEVDPRLGGAVLRSDPREMRGGRYYELGLDGDGATLERFRSRREGGRDAEPITVTREQLERLVDDMEEGLRG